MKKLTSSLLVFSFSLQALAVEMPVNVRNNKMKINVEKIEIPSQLAETPNFRILKGTDNESLDLLSADLSDNDRLRAGTVLHHLNIARDYFVNTLGSAHAGSLPQLNVRIEMNRPYNEFYKFISDSKIQEYNNAVTVPASTPRAMPEAGKWNPEIWFRPAEEMEIDNAVYTFSKQMDQTNLMGPVTDVLTQQGIQEAVTNQILYGSLASVDYMGYVTTLLYTVGIFEVAPKVLMWATGDIKSKSFLDSAMIPEVAYHEYAHVALSDHISLRQSTAMNEGMANYFAAVISGQSKIAAKNGDHSKNVGNYDGKKHVMYDSRMESTNAAHANFVFSFLWQLRQRMKKEYKGGDITADKLIFNARKYVSYAKKPIKDDLLPALIKSVNDIFSKGESRKARMVINDEAKRLGL